jgi:hypothetical protein
MLPPIPINTVFTSFMGVPILGKTFQRTSVLGDLSGNTGLT